MKAIAVLALLAVASPAFAEAPRSASPTPPGNWEPPLSGTPAPPGYWYGSDQAYIFRGPVQRMPFQPRPNPVSPAPQLAAPQPNKGKAIGRIATGETKDAVRDAATEANRQLGTVHLANQAQAIDSSDLAKARTSELGDPGEDGKQSRASHEPIQARNGG